MMVSLGPLNESMFPTLNYVGTELLNINVSDHGSCIPNISDAVCHVLHEDEAVVAFPPFPILTIKSNGDNFFQCIS